MAGGAYRTRQDLVLEALANLGVLSPGQPTDADDYSYVDEKLDSIMRLLAGLAIVYVPDLSQIPGVYFSPLADIVAGECCTKFGVTADDFITLTNKGLGGATGPMGAVQLGAGTGAMALKALTRGRPTGEVLKSEFM